MSKKNPDCENDVKDLVKDWFKAKGGWSYAPIQNGLGEHGIHDRIGGIPVTVTPAMVGKVINLAVTIEAKAPDRRGEKDRGMSKHQVLFQERVLATCGFSICCDGLSDLESLDNAIAELLHEPMESE